MQSNIIYSSKCSGYDHGYIGKTDRRAVRRMRVHEAPKDAFGESKISEDEDVYVDVLSTYPGTPVIP
jgi:hypothetical protein